jgi:hypothetical protein
MLIQQDLSQTDAFRCYLHEFIWANVLHGFFQAEFNWGCKSGVVIFTCRTHVVQLLGNTWIDNEVTRLVLLTDNLATVDLITWLDKEFTAIL